MAYNDPDSIAVKFAELQNLRASIAKARANLTSVRERQSGYTRNTENQNWDDEAFRAKFTRHQRADQVTQSIEEKLNETERAIDVTEQNLMGAVQRSMGAF
ncbi:hypothetical protein [Lentzea cavernae]|uniref:WXG100 family type VII secretion target n=1 Tax=Lentzea cavernae TaxID=2020703 RepID=A0ABQ3MHI2_9PSEU|nr:hypothetical protein [Lentzea cavernae]GHH44118.1 hypothetical protein GCM10017774_43120 [Lentzea cavernae]